MNKLLDSLHKKILKSKFAEEVTEAEIDALVEAKEYNGGWIPCSSGTMPNENETIMLTFKNSAGLHVGEATYKNRMFFYVTDTEFGYYEEVYKNPIAWKTKYAPYQPKGE